MTDPEKAHLLQPDQLCADDQHAQPTNIPTKTAPQAKLKLWILFAVLVLCKSALVFSLLAHRLWTSRADVDLSGVCLQPFPVNPSNWTQLYKHEGFAEESAKRLSGAVRIPTQSV